jgi:hypothetical protein
MMDIQRRNLDNGRLEGTGTYDGGKVAELNRIATNLQQCLRRNPEQASREPRCAYLDHP